MTLFIIKRESIINETGKYSINENQIIIYWDNWKEEDIFIKSDMLYYHKKFYLNYIYKFRLSNYYFYNNYENNINNYVLNIDKNIIFKKYNLNYIGNFKLLENNILIIKWNNKVEDETFIYLNDIYYEIKDLINFIENNNIEKGDKIYDEYIFNKDMKKKY